jgi:hypothetical protein
MFIRTHCDCGRKLSKTANGYRRCAACHVRYNVSLKYRAKRFGLQLAAAGVFVAIVLCIGICSVFGVVRSTHSKCVEFRVPTVTPPSITLPSISSPIRLVPDNRIASSN